MENLRKKNQTEILETKKFLKSNKKYSWKSSKLEQVEYRISGLEARIHIKEKSRLLRQKTK
jgi:hypothetical protein